jgi:inner membrane protein
MEAECSARRYLAERLTFAAIGAAAVHQHVADATLHHPQNEIYSHRAVGTSRGYCLALSTGGQSTLEAVTIMMAGSHVVVGAAAWMVVAPHLGLPPLDPIALAWAIGGSLLPDIDHPHSWVGRRVQIVSRPLASIIGHRGVTHSILAVVACAVLLRWHGLRRATVDPLIVGYVSHLGADLLTARGLPLTWPLQCRYAIPLCKTGSPAEALIVVSLVLWLGARALGINMPSLL